MFTSYSILAHLEYWAIDCKLLFAVEELTAIALIVGVSALASLLIVCLRGTVRRPYLLRLFLGLQASIEQSITIGNIVVCQLLDFTDY